jgi:hypothetical protein
MAIGIDLSIAPYLKELCDVFGHLFAGPGVPFGSAQEIA